jgi:spermidine/putrescine transport system substrate-binding protein
MSSVENEAARILKNIQQNAVGRRGFMRGAGIAAMGVATPSLLAACGTKAAVQNAGGATSATAGATGTASPTGQACVSTDISASDPRLNFSNWPAYIDRKAGHRPSLEAFEKQSGIAVTYTQDINDNTEFFNKVQAQLGDCQPTGRDLIVMTDWMAAKMIGLGWIQTLDHSAIPNVDANLRPSLQHPAWDPNRDHSAPWQSGVTGLAYNAKYTKGVSSFQDLLTRKDLKGKVSLLTEMHDTMGFMVKAVGADPSNFTATDWQNAIDYMTKAVTDGQIRRFTGNDYINDLNDGNIVACEAWSGDIIQMQYDNPDIKWVVPDEGLSLWSDNMLVPNKADHKANAEALMNYYYEPQVAAQLAAWVNYICPVEGAQQAMKKIDKTLVDNPLIFPDASFLANTWGFMSLDSATESKYQTDFTNAQIG